MISDLKPYPAYRDSGVPWLGEVPEHWEVARIKLLFRERDERSRDGQGLLLSLTRERGLLPQSEASNRLASAENLSKYKVCRPGYLVMNRMQAWSGMFATSDIDGLISPDYSVFAPVVELRMDYFKHLFKTPLFVDQFAQRSKGIGSGFNRLYTPDFGAVPIAFPQVAEQAAIVRFLNYLDWRIRRYIRAKQRLIKLLEEQKQAIIHRAVTRGLDPNVRLKPSGVEWLGDVPEHWEVMPLKSSVSNVIQQTAGRDDSDLYVALEHVESWTGRLRNPGLEVTFESQVKRFQAGDVLFGKLRPYLAKVTRPRSDGVCVGEFFVLRPRAANLIAPYVEQLLRSKPIIDTINSSTFGAKMPRADWQFIGRMQFPLPPLPEQTAIVRYLDAATANIITAIDQTHREIALLREYRTRLIADVVTGKLDVREVAARLPDEAEEPEPLDDVEPTATGDEKSEGTDFDAALEETET